MPELESEDEMDEMVLPHGFDRSKRALFILPLRCNVAMLVNSIRQDMEKEIIFIGIFGEQGTEKVTYVYTNHRSSGRKPTSTAGPIVH